MKHYNQKIQPEKSPISGKLPAKKYNFILDRTFYIGDDLRDIEASYRSKTRCMYIGKEKLSAKLKKKYINTLILKNNNERR